MPDCVIVQEVCKRAGERIAFPPFELVDRLARSWESEQPFGDGVAVRPKGRRSTGLEYVSSGGVTGEREPKWPSVVGGTIDEGPITWTAQLISNASLIYRIESKSYDVPSGINNHEQAFIDEPGSQQVPMEVSGGDAIGKTYDVVAKVQMTTVGSSVPLYELVLRVTIE